MMKRIMLIGQSQCGKTSLLQRLQGEPMQYQKTQALGYFDCAIDTPGEYLENRCLYSALITTSCDADIIALVQSADCQQGFFCADVCYRIQQAGDRHYYQSRYRKR